MPSAYGGAYIVPTWQVDYADLPRLEGRLSTSPEIDKAHIDVALDEGCELCCITEDAITRSFDAWRTGHAPFASNPKVGKPRGLFFKRPIPLFGFHGDSDSGPLMVLLHVVIGHAVYPVRAIVIKNAPTDVEF